MILSIIVPVYNVEKYLEKCLISTQNQDILSSEYEVIVVNDGSPDNSIEIANRLSSQYDNIKVFSKSNGGLSSSRNFGMKEAIGDYYMFLDSDDWIEENCLGKIVNQLKKEQPDCLAICGANIYGEVVQKRRNHPNITPTTGVKYLVEGAQDGAPFAIWKSSFLKKHNLTFFEGIYHEDSELTIRAYYLAEKVSRTDDIVYYVYQNPNSITRSINYKKSFDIINVVCEHLHVFYSQIIEDEAKRVFDNRISMYINNALNGCKDAPPDIIKKLNDEIYNNRMFFKHLKNGTSKKYRLEYYLFNIFPHNVMSVYNFLRIFV